MVNLLSRTNPEFVAQYRAARVIIDRGVRHKETAPSNVPPKNQ